MGLKQEIDNYCIEKFGATTGNDQVRDAFEYGYNLALKKGCCVMSNFLITYRENELENILYWHVKVITEDDAINAFWRTHDVLCDLIDIKLYESKRIKSRRSGNVTNNDRIKATDR